MALFATNVPHQTTHLVEFGAGKMSVRGKMVHPDPRKGTIFLYQSDDGLMHFCWKDASTGTVEDDLIVFPDDAEFKAVKQCTTGRVYLLSFKNPSRKMFFWMQAFKCDRDDEYCKKVNDLLNNPPAPGAGGRSRAGAAGQENLNDQFSMVNQLLNMSGGGAGGLSGEDINNALAGVDRRQMMQLLNLMGGGSGAGLSEAFGAPHARSPTQSGASSNQRAVPTAATRAAASVPSGNLLTTPTTGSGATSAPSGSAPKPGAQQQPIINAADFSKILSSLGVTAAGSPARSDVDLENVLTLKNVEPILIENTQNVDRLVPHLPTETPITADKQEVSKTLLSPQFRQAVGTFGEALKSGQLGPFMQQFGFSSDVIKAFDKGDAQSVAEMLEKESDKKESKIVAGSETCSDQQKSKEGDEKAKKNVADKEKKDDDPMDLD